MVEPHACLLLVNVDVWVHVDIKGFQAVKLSFDSLLQKGSSDAILQLHTCDSKYIVSHQVEY